MKKKRRIWVMKSFFIPTIAIGLVIVLFPWITFPTHPIYTLSYLYVAILIFLNLLRSKDSFPFEFNTETEKTFDKSVTIIIRIISIPIFVFFGVLSVLIILCWKRSIYVVASIFSFIIIYVYGIKLKTSGEFPEGQFIVTPNHCAGVDDVLDPIIMMKRFKVLFASEIRRIAFAQFFLKRFGIPISRAEETSRIIVTRKMKKELDAGFDLLIKPEGRRLVVSEEKENQELLMPFDKGAFFLSKVTDKPILPVVISWTFRFKPRSGQWWYSPCTITIYYLDPVKIGTNESVEQFTERVRSSMLEVLEESIEVIG